MKIIIAGAGKIGYSVADILTAEGHDITVIDNDSATIDILSNNLDVICVEGSATNSETLLEAGAADADLLMAATRSDETNMVCGISARKLGTKHVIARIRDTAYLRACRESAAQAAEVLDWYKVACVRDGALRSVEDIHQEIWQQVKTLLS